METFINILSQPFTWGLLLGLCFAFYIWRLSSKDKKFLKTELTRLNEENKDIQGHLNRQLKITAKGDEQLQNQLAELREQNENLRVNLTSVQQKPGKLEQRKLEVMELAVSAMREQAPGFAPAWEKALRDAEDEREDAESGLKKLMRKVVPGFRATPSAGSTKHSEEIEMGGE